MKTKLIIVIISIFFINLSFAQRPVYEWIRTANGTSWDEASAVACDNYGNSISTGYFDGSFNIGDSTFNTGIYSDIFLIKHDSNGNLIWAKQLACERGAFGESVCLDDSGNSFLAGTFVDSICINNVMYYGYSTQAGFVTKFDQYGNVLWFHSFGGENGWVWPTDLMALNNGDIVCTGMIGGTVTIGDSIFSTQTEISFLVHYSSSGDFLNVTDVCECSNQLETLGIASDGMDNIFIGGNFRGTLSFSDTSITSAGYDDIFIAKFDNQDNIIWARQEGDIYSDIGLDVTADPQGNSAITGYFPGSITIGDTTLTSLGLEDIFIIKYDPDGNVSWVRQAGGNVYYALDEAYGIKADDDGNFYLAGHFEGSSYFGDTTLVSSGMTDIFCAKYDSLGNCIWAAKAGGSDEEWGADIALNNQGDIFLSGWYASSFTFGDTLITNTDATDVYVIKLTESEINSINKRPNYPFQYKLYQNYPNPFNPSTKIRFTISKSEKVRIEVFNLLGQKIETLINKQMPTGLHEIDYNVTELSSGIYLYRIKAGEFQEVRKMILLK